MEASGLLARLRTKKEELVKMEAKIITLEKEVAMIRQEIADFCERTENNYHPRKLIHQHGSLPKRDQNVAVWHMKIIQESAQSGAFGITHPRNYWIFTWISTDINLTCDWSQ